MERMKKWFSKWALALLATLMVLTGLVGCSSKDVETALDVAIEVMEVVESLEAMETETQTTSESVETEMQTTSESVETETQTTSEPVRGCAND